MECRECKVTFSDDEVVVKCYGPCKGSYHLDCSTISQRIYATKTEEQKSKWSCVACRPSKKRGDGLSKVSVSTEETEETNDEEEQIADMANYEQRFQSFLVLMKKEWRAMMEEIKKDVKEERAKIHESFAEIRDSQNFISQQYEDFKEQLKLTTKKADEAVKRVEELESTIKARDSEVLDLKKRLQGCEQYLRRRTVEIKGIAETQGEDVPKLVIDTVKRLGIDMKPEDIDAAHRVPSKTSPLPIIVEFKSRLTRNTILSKKSLLKPEDRPANKDDVYINESLSPYFKNLLWFVKSRLSEYGLYSCWFRNKFVYVRKEEKSKPIAIATREDFMKKCT